jgi:glycosyltransferase involved in cell wall biosynthesis
MNINIIINCLNGEEYLEYTLNSVLKQTLTNWKIVFIDNASSDNSALLLHKLIPTEKLTYIKSQYVLPLGEARNIALNNLDGKYFCFLDCDDIWGVNKLKIQSMILDKNTNVGMVYNQCRFNRRKKIDYDLNAQYSAQEKKYNDILSNYDIPMSGAMLRTSTIVGNNIKFNNTFEVLEDKEFFLNVSKITIILKISIHLVFWRIHSNSTTHNKFNLFSKENKKLLSDYINESGKKIDHNIVKNLKSKIRFQSAVGSWIDGNYIKARQTLTPKIFNRKFFFMYLVTYLPNTWYIKMAKIYMNTKIIFK